MIKYTWNDNGYAEVWTNDAFNTINECIEDAKSHGIKVGEKIVVAETWDYEPTMSGYGVLEELENDAYQLCGEVAEDWLDYSKSIEIDILAQRLTDVINKWLEETNQKPTFRPIEILEEVVIE